MNFGAIFAPHQTVDVVQLVRTSDCGSEGRGFESHLPPEKKSLSRASGRALFFHCVESLLSKANGKNKARNERSE